MKLLFSIFLFFLARSLTSQDIKVVDFKSLPLDVSARANPVIDANGDVCAIIKVRTGIDSLRFSGDLEIRKIEKHEGEFWLWVSPMTKKLSILTAESGNIEFTLPLYSVGSSVYSLDLLVSLPDKVVIRESHTAEITTKPKKAQVYINGVFMGRSPVLLNSLENSIQYEIRKKKYTTVTGDLLLNEVQAEVPVRLNRDPKANRMFASLYTGGNKLGTLFYGIKVGQMGKTGWYISFVPTLRNKNNIGIVFDPDQFGLLETELAVDVNYDAIIRITGISPEGCYFILKDKNNTFYDHFRIKFGITQNIYKNIFLNIGLGYGSSTKYIKVLMVPYDNDPKADVPFKETLCLRSYLSDLNYIALDAGFSYRVLNHYIISLDVTPSYYETYLEPKTGWRTEISVGVGYNF